MTQIAEPDRQCGLGHAEFRVGQQPFRVLDTDAGQIRHEAHADLLLERLAEVATAVRGFAGGIVEGDGLSVTCIDKVERCADAAL